MPEPFPVFQSILFLLSVLSICISSVSLLISLITFPFYVHVNRQNLPSEKFPLQLHIYRITCVSEVLTGGLLILGVIFVPIGSRILLECLVFFGLGVAILRTIIALAANLMLSLLAVHRFLLYFFSNIRDFQLNKFSWQWKLLSYSISIALIIHCVAVYQEEHFPYIVNIIVYFLGGLSNICFVPYTIMVLAISRNQKMQSNASEQLVKYQIITALVCKLLTIPFFFSMPKITQVFSHNCIPIVVTYSLTYSLATQVAYLLSKKKEVKMLWKTRGFLWVLREQFRWRRKNSGAAVHPMSEGSVSTFSSSGTSSVSVIQPSMLQARIEPYHCQIEVKSNARRISV